jgi:sugar/nucleoside kinase (ribokinase family)
LFRGARTQSISTEETAQLLRKLTGCQLVAITNGGEGCSLVAQVGPSQQYFYEYTVCLFVCFFLKGQGGSVQVPATRLQRVIDATGAGDAFLGGLVAGAFCISSGMNVFKM